MKVENPGSWKIVHKYQSFIVFLIAECLAFVSFGLANVNTVYRFLGLIVALILLAYAFLFSSKTERKTFIIYAVPLVLYSIIMCLSVFGGAYFDSLDNISLFTGLISFLYLGFAVKKMKNVDVDIFFLTIGISLGLLVLISALYSLVRYGFFHPLIYKNMYYYYNGDLFNVSKEMKFLVGFSLHEVSLDYVGLFTTILTGYLAPLAFLKFNENKKKFLLFLACGLVGILTNIFITNIFALVVAAVVLVFVLCYKFIPRNEKNKKIITIILIVIASLIAAFLFAFFINACVGGFAFIKKNSFLKRVFMTSSYTKPWFDSIFIMTRPEGIFGFANYLYDNGGYAMSIFNTKYGTSCNFPTNSGSFVFDACLEGGLFAFITLAAFVVMAIWSTYNYIFKAKDEDYHKALVLAVVLGVFIYGNLFYNSLPLVHYQNTYHSFARSMPMLISLFFLGYSFYPLFKDKQIEEELLLVEEEYQKDLLTSDEEENKNEDE